MGQTLIAILGTLAGVALTSLFQARTDRRARTDARRAEGLGAVEALVAALADHRRAMWVREDLRLRGEDWTEARTASHATRSAITAPLLRVQLLLPAVVADAQAAVQAAYDLRAARSTTALAQRRTEAITASDDLVSAVGRHVARVR
ncbi:MULTISPECIES: protein kilB [unclassified Streptomyces]|uniref:protein kilB n=1 Tax=unclassified Streptomyces TaxID=2593676 RepID=UPI0035E02AF2